MTYAFDRYFRLKILCLLLDAKWYASYGLSIIKSDYFDEDGEREIASALLDYIETYKHPPKEPDDVIVMLNGNHQELVYEIYDLQYEDIDFTFTADVVIQFAREQAAKIAVLDGVDDIKTGDLSMLMKRLEEATSVGSSLLSPGINLKNTGDWLYALWADKVRTGWTHIDNVLEGGLAPGELGIILAAPNRGKSMSLVSIGYGAASIGSKKNVIHFTHEMSKEVLAKRYAARMVFRFPKRNEDLYQYDEDFTEAARKLMPGQVRIIGGAETMSVSEMKSHVSRLVTEGFNPGLIIDDYPDLLVPDIRYKERRFELSSIYLELRAIGAEFNVPIWGASQANRASLSKEVITIKDIAEDIGKAAIADVIVALCQTDEEYNMEQARLFMAKVRDGKRNFMFNAKYYDAQQAIITTGFATKKGEVDA